MIAEQEFRRNCFGFIRLILALAVVDGHNPIFSLPFVLGHAVKSFFVLSGFLVVASCLRHGVVDYFRARALRIFPGLITVVLVAAIFGAVITTLPPMQYFSSPQFFSYMFWNSLTLDFFQKGLPGIAAPSFDGIINGPVYTLKIELGCYLLLPLVLLIGKKIGNLNALIVFYSGACLWSAGWNWVFEATGQLLFHKLSYQSPGMAAYFFAGAICFVILERLKPILPGLIPVGLVLIYCAQYAAPLAQPLILPWGLSLFFIGCAYTFVGLEKLVGRTDLSYGIYLYHWPVGVFLTSLYPQLSAPSARFWPTLGITFLCAAVSWRLIESPFVKRKAALQPSVERQ